MKSRIIEEFLEGTPKWIETMKKMEKYGGTKNCIYCGMSSDKMEELYNDIRELYGEEWMFIKNNESGI